MRWSDRVELSFRVFRRCWLPLYAWYLIFFVAFFLAFVLVWLILLADAGFRGFMNGFLYYDFYPRSIELLLRFLPAIIPMFILSVLLEGAIIAGTFNITKKAYFDENRPHFRDFRFTGTLRAIGWAVVVTVIGFLALVCGAVFPVFISNPSLAMLLTIAYGFLLAALGIFFAPWFLTSYCYVLAQPQMSFAEAFSSSFSFFFRHMGKLWGYVGLTVIFFVALLALDHSFPTIGEIAQFLFLPLGGVIPVVWVLSILEEEKESLPEPPISAKSTAISEGSMASERSMPSENGDAPPEKENSPHENSPHG